VILISMFAAMGKIDESSSGSTGRQHVFGACGCASKTVATKGRFDGRGSRGSVGAEWSERRRTYLLQLGVGHARTAVKRLASIGGGVAAKMPANIASEGVKTISYILCNQVLHETYNTDKIPTSHHKEPRKPLAESPDATQTAIGQGLLLFTVGDAFMPKSGVESAIAAIRLALNARRVGPSLEQQISESALAFQDELDTADRSYNEQRRYTVNPTQTDTEVLVQETAALIRKVCCRLPSDQRIAMVYWALQEVIAREHLERMAAHAV